MPPDDSDIYNLQLCTVQSPFGNFSLANHQGYWLTERLGDKTTVHDMKLVADELRQLPQPLVLAGDLNVIAASPALRVFDNWLEDLTATRGVDTTLSGLGKVTDVACDHILISPDVKVTGFSVADDLVSDHKAVILDFDL